MRPNRGEGITRRTLGAAAASPPLARLAQDAAGRFARTDSPLALPGAPASMVMHQLCCQQGNMSVLLPARWPALLFTGAAAGSAHCSRSRAAALHFGGEVLVRQGALAAGAPSDCMRAGVHR